MKVKWGKVPVAAMLFISLLCSEGCKKKSIATNDPGGNNSPPIDSVYNPTDPAVAATIGFFGDAWKAKSFIAPAVLDGSVPSVAPTDSLTIDVNKVLVKVPPYVYGNNSNLWMGQIVTQPALMQYITDLSPNIIRGPGGSISDVYFWNGTDASPAPPDAPANLLNSGGTAGAAGYWYGGNAASWTFSLAIITIYWPKPTVQELLR